jgi:streptogramin lyase
VRGMRTRSRLWAAAATTALAMGLGAGSAAAAPVGLVERFELGCTPRALIAGPGGNVWFTCLERAASGGRGKVGLIAPSGQAVTFGDGIDPNSEPGEMAVGADGNVWFTINPGINLLPRDRYPAALGRVTPAGQITTFRAGLSPDATLGDIAAGPDGAVWFTEAGPAPAIGRIAPNGEIVEFRAGLAPNSTPGGIAAGLDGALWFSDRAATFGRITTAGFITEFGPAQSRLGTVPAAPATGSDGRLWLSGGAQRPGVARIDPFGTATVTEFSAGLDPANSLLGPIVAGPEGNMWFTARGLSDGPAPRATVAIGRVSPSGEIAEFSKCLHGGPPFTGPESIVAGPDGNMWFTSVTSRRLPSIGTPPAIGRITPSGEITEFRGLGSEPKSIVAGPDGRIWFAGGESSETIERITPPSAPVNTFLVEGTRRATRGGLAKLRVTVPGPGVLRLEQRALLLPRQRQRRLPHRTTTIGAASCGRAVLGVRARGAAWARFRATGRARLKVLLTFTPTGGSPHRRAATVSIHR